MINDQNVTHAIAMTTIATPLMARPAVFNRGTVELAWLIGKMMRAAGHKATGSLWGNGSDCERNATYRSAQPILVRPCGLAIHGIWRDTHTFVIELVSVL